MLTFPRHHMTMTSSSLPSRHSLEVKEPDLLQVPQVVQIEHLAAPYIDDDCDSTYQGKKILLGLNYFIIIIDIFYRYFILYLWCSSVDYMIQRAFLSNKKIISKVRMKSIFSINVIISYIALHKLLSRVTC